MPGSKNSKSSDSPGLKSDDFPALPSYSQTTVSDSARIDVLQRDQSVFKNRMDDFDTQLTDLKTLSEAILASVKGDSPLQDTASPKNDEEISDVSSTTKP